MDSYQQRPISVTSQCLAIVLSKPDGRELPANSGGTSSRSTSSNGWKIFQDLQDENRGSFWNPALVESVMSLDFVGFMRPGTLLVSGSELHLECLRGAWARRVLKPPRGYGIKSLGDIGGIEMQAVPQTQFIPLPEVLCLLISNLNKAGQPATFPVITIALQEEYAGMTVPKAEVLYAALSALVAEGKVYCMGDHYFVSTPLMYQQYQANFAQHKSVNNNNFLYQPSDMQMAQSSSRGSKSHHHRSDRHATGEMRTIECQTGASIVNAPAYRPPKKDQATSAQGESTSTTSDENINRASRARAKEKTGDAKAEKQGGFFKRFFRRSKSRDAVKYQLNEAAKSQPPTQPLQPTAKPQIAPNVLKDHPAASSVLPTMLPVQAPLETFSAQFPPTEWLHDPRFLRAENQPMFFKSRRSNKSQKERQSVWIDFDPNSGKMQRKSRQEQRIPGSKRFVTVPENLNGNPGSDERNRRSRHRLNKYMSSSSECVNNLAPLDRTPGRNYAVLPEVAGDIELYEHRRYSRTRYLASKPNYAAKEMENLDKFPVSEPYRDPTEANTDQNSVKSGSDRVRRKVFNDVCPRQSAEAPLAVPTDDNLDTTATENNNKERSSSPLIGVAGGSAQTPPVTVELRQKDGAIGRSSDDKQRSSDSAFSASPVVTEMSSGSSADTNKYSSWSGSEGQQPNNSLEEHHTPEKQRQILDHTYINTVNGRPADAPPSPIPHVFDKTYENISRHLMRHHQDTTQFENITELEEPESGKSLAEDGTPRGDKIQVSSTILRLSTSGNLDSNSNVNSKEIDRAESERSVASAGSKKAHAYISAV